MSMQFLLKKSEDNYYPLLLFKVFIWSMHCSLYSRCQNMGSSLSAEQAQILQLMVLRLEMCRNKFTSLLKTPPICSPPFTPIKSLKVVQSGKFYNHLDVMFDWLLLANLLILGGCETGYVSREAKTSLLSNVHPRLLPFHCHSPA